ncbi:cobyrinate a,c-diamide synthase [Phycicoccus flavus]|uniref:Hydrogenobyrinate a,c-diamide synthase n=1 Tax=Phycicoccus flavus TaxID=2502783 RepID=A0A8T6R033_9MICO|nr:cobyrinate a,c-diamide synthase [Phycicoccus flavus]NHA67297.1 cobyrinate a,c-diamide synthase [Phycicoccus flavus]
MTVPRVVVAAAASGQGKTTVAVGLMAALSRAGHDVAAAKVGPDYIDPGYHALATGRPGRNLDPWLQGEERVLPLLAHAAMTPAPADVTVVEGVMGLFDGRLGTDGWSSTAHVAALTASPVLLVLDISSAARTVAATVHGLRTFDPDVHVGGVVLNKAGSDRHAAEVRRAVEALGVPVLGVLPRDAGVSAPSRHLGLVPVAERDDAVTALDRLAEQTARLVDLDAVLALARSAPGLDAEPWAPPAGPVRAPRRVAVAGGRAFTFRYAEIDELLRAQGCEPVVFDPALDPALPDGTSGIYLGGGFPEVHAATLAGNTSLLADIGDAVRAGIPTVAECAGLLYLAEAVEGHALVGAVPTTAAMHPRLTLRYRTATAAADTLLGAAGATVHGHEFHRTRTTPGAGDAPGWLLDGEAEGWSLDPAGTGSPTLHASYLHVHWAGHPDLAARFADAVHAAPSRVPLPVPETPVRLGTGVPAGQDAVADPLRHHGDAEATPGLVDLAVNVRGSAPPPWLAEHLRRAVGDLAAYPSADAARAALARRHGVPEAAVLPTAGAAEAFTLLARALHPRRAVVVHPQFTEPEAALRLAGTVPEHVVLRAEDDFALDPAAVPADADLVVLGNPTNPTGVLHPREAVEALRAPGRVLVVDEAFADTDARESASVVGPDLAGLLVLRSLTKTWALAGLRAGYVVGDPVLLARLAEQQPPWSVGTLAARVMVETASPLARAEAARAAEETAGWRHHLLRGLRDLGLRPVPSATSFVLVEVGDGVREALRERGYAVRRGDTFPGLGPQWVRIAVRDPLTSDGLLRELGRVLASRRERSA